MLQLRMGSQSNRQEDGFQIRSRSLPALLQFQCDHRNYTEVEGISELGDPGPLESPPEAPVDGLKAPEGTWSANLPRCPLCQRGPPRQPGLEPRGEGSARPPADL